QGSAEGIFKRVTGGGGAASPANGAWQTLASQQRLRLRLAAAEGDEAFQRRTARAHGEDFTAEAVAGGGVDRALAGVCALFEGAERVRAQQLRPQIAVVAGGVATRKNVRKGMGETLPGRRMQHGHFMPDLLEHFERACALGRV